jgi:cytochrome c oxidase subunit 2
MTRQTLASNMIVNNPENLKKWVNDPQEMKQGCLMPSFKLTDQELNQVVSYLETLK